MNRSEGAPMLMKSQMSIGGLLEPLDNFSLRCLQDDVEGADSEFTCSAFYTFCSFEPGFGGCAS